MVRRDKQSAVGCARVSISYKFSSCQCCPLSLLLFLPLPTYPLRLSSPFSLPPCRCFRHCRAYQQHNLSWRVPQFPALPRSISLSPAFSDFQLLRCLFCRILWANSPRRCCLSHAFAITNIVLCAQQTSPSTSSSSLAFRVLPRPPGA